MNTYHRYETLLRIQTQLQDWSAYQPSWHYKLHGSKEINECLQIMKQLISHEAMTLLAEESQKMGLYYEEGDVNSLGLHNIE